MKHEVNIDQLLADYQKQSTSNGKHAYSEQLHNDTGSGCCLCDLCDCGCSCFNCLTSC